jgi:hypothetical protein
MPASLTYSLAGDRNGNLVPVGFVAAVQGTWVRTRDGTVLQVPDPVFPSTTIKTRPSTTSSITVALFDGRTWKQNCTAEKPCSEQVFAVPHIPAGQRGFLSFLSTYLSAQKRVPVVFTASRSPSFGQGPVACVLELKTGHLDLSPCLTGIAPGTLNVKLMTAGSGSQDDLSSYTLEWPSVRTIALGSTLTGVYVLSVSDERQQPLGQPTAALILPRNSPATTRVKRELEMAKAVAAQWKDIDASAVRRFLIQVVYALEAASTSQ